MLRKLLILLSYVAASLGNLAGRTSRAVCTTPECVIAAANILESMDQTVDPCQDFFQFSCGGWIKKHPIPDSKYSFTQFDILNEELYAILEGILSEPENPTDAHPVNAARELFSACMDIATRDSVGLKPLTDLLAMFGGWPMTLDNWGGQFNWKDATVASLQLFKKNYFLYVYNSLDVSDTTRNTIYIDQGSLALPRAALVSPESSPVVIDAYRNFIREAAKAIRTNLGSSLVTDQQIEAEVNEIVNFEFALAKLTTPPEDRRNNSRLYNPMLVSEVQVWTDSVSALTDNGKINWNQYLNEIYSIASISVDASEKVIVRETEYLRKLLSFLDASPTRTIANYIHWRFVMDLGYYTNTEMVNLAFDFAKVLLGTSQPQPRSTSCTMLANNLLSFALSAKYVTVAFDEDAKLETELMINDLKTAFKTLVDDAAWMDDATKAYAREKVDNMLQLVGYPDWILNNTALENFYNGLEVAAGTHFANIQNAHTVNNIREYRELRKGADRTKWKLPPSIVNAAHDPERNSIVLPAGILQPPFFGKGRLAATNYGGIGNVIGHEITHGFDDRGRQYDKNGNLVDWWTPETSASYVDRAQCFIDQYSNYSVPSGSHINGVKTQGENIADNGGLREAFRAYNIYLSENGAEPQLPGLEKFSSEQIFFLSFANLWCGHETPEFLESVIMSDSHSPQKYRVLGSISNNEDFARHFNCPVGSPMNRVNDCIIW